MGFYELYKEYKNFDFDDFFISTTADDVYRAIEKPNKDPLDFLRMLSPAAAHDPVLESMAQSAHKLTERFFGRTITVFTPLYLANICENGCLYCGFNRNNPVKRAILSPEEVEIEGKAIRDQGIRHIIILTGESRKASPPEYIASCVKILKKYVDSISIEVYSLTKEEYRMLFDAGVDGFTMFQETYNEDIYPILHPVGEKRDYRKRLDSPELACQAHYNSVNLGALLGLDDWRKDTFFTGLHAMYLQQKYPGTDIAVSLPRICEHEGETHFRVHSTVSDIDLVQAMVAYRLFIPRLGITVSTREPASFRDRLIGLGVTKMSAGSVTEVGGHG
ncbi:MAG: 2-iminoacetate synthase ThiH, partial [Clostridiales bacterium]|nr:2-iminoacetate synthase ThiH [Clostridiales bacterium]